MELPVFYRDVNCKDCGLYANMENESSVCLGCRPFKPPTGKRVALLCIGENPGLKEDQKGECFVGPTGILLQRQYLDPKAIRKSLWDFTEHADVYMTNAVRCRTESVEVSIPKDSLTKCKKYLINDVQTLQAKYEEVVLLCLGTVATQSVHKKLLTKSFGSNGQIIQLPDCAPTRMFCTWHPAALLNRRDPSKIRTVFDHMKMLHEYLTGGRIWKVLPSDVNPEIAPEPPPAHLFPHRIAYDIETYGCIQGLPKQRYFIGPKCEHLDKVRRSDIVWCSAFGWRDKDGKLRSAWFSWKNPDHLRKLRLWFRAIRDNKAVVCGSNIKFDISMTRYIFPDWIPTILNHKSFMLEDIGAWGYLHNELRSERGLKPVSNLFGILEYKETAKDTKFSGIDDFNLIRYNAEDCLATIVGIEMFIERILQDYGPNTPKLSQYCKDWYSQLIWSTVYLQEAGMAVDVEKLRKRLRREEALLERIRMGFATKYGKPLMGENSQDTKNSMADRAFVLCGLQKDPRVKAGKTGQISLDTENRNLFMDTLDKLIITGEATQEQIDMRTELKWLAVYKKHEKTVSAYLRPFLGMCIDGKLYPNWFPFPSVPKETGSVKGTIQCRETCSEPGLQTAPSRIKKTYVPSFRKGFLLAVDMSQIELRVAALLANERNMIEEYKKLKPDLHGRTAKIVFGEDIVHHSKYDDLYRQGGKQTNFAVLFWAEAKTLHETFMKKLKFFYPIEDCAKLIEKFYREYPDFKNWQLGLIETAIRNGWLYVPLMGASRLFLGSKRVIERTYKNTIVNLPVQATAANILISAQATIQFALWEAGLKSVVNCQIYDALYITGPKTEYTAVRRIIDPILKNPPYFQDLCRELGRTIPLQYDVKLELFN